VNTASFRVAAEMDLPVLFELFPLYYAADDLQYDAGRAENAIRAFLRDPSFGRLWMISAEDGGVAVGYLAVTFGFSFEFGGRTALVDELFVRAEAQGRGLGSAAIRHALAECRREGLVAVRLEVTPKNRRAANLYMRLGFTDLSRSLLSYRLT
jgi:ribosomal protein S18 acetylase RimI-like enzyme